MVITVLIFNPGLQWLDMGENVSLYVIGLPKDKHQLKQAMVTQLGIEEASLNQPQVESEEKLSSELKIESELEKEE